MIDGMNITVVDSVFNPRSSDRTVLVKEGESRSLYKVYLYLEGPDLPYVRSATYVLHSTFRNRTRTINRSATNPNCQLEIWTWGLFRVQVKIEDKRGRSSVVEHDLRYDADLEPGGDSQYRYVS